MKLHLFINDNNHHFKEYLALIEETLTSEKRQLQKDIDEYKFEGKECDSTEDDLGYRKLLFEEKEQLMYRSFIISVFIFMEVKISHLCDHIQKEYNQSLSYKDLKGSGVTRSVTYLEKIVKADFISDRELKHHFHVARLIRNSIVHTEGLVPEGDTQVLKKYITDYPKLLELSDKKLLINHKYSETILKINEDVCKEIGKHWTIETNLS